MSSQASTISVLAKPAGPDCNLRCTYCFYRQKAGMFPESKIHRMSESTLENLIAQSMEYGRDLVMFSWQGGEPTLMGLEFFKKVVKIQERYLRPTQVVSNALQTNGTLLDRQWAKFLREHAFLVGVSLDGPKSLHDHYRRDGNGKGTYDRVLQTIRMLMEEGVEVNTLTLVNDQNVQHPDSVYQALCATGVKWFQFVPCVEPGPKHSPAFYSVNPELYGDFLCRLFDLWLDSPIDISIRDFDDFMLIRQGHVSTTCTTKPYCGGYVVVEHTGDVFPCDFFVLPRWRLGNVNETPLSQLLHSDKLREFGEQKAKLSDHCHECPWLPYCYGGCCKYRIILGGSISEPTYLCPAYQRFYSHATSVLDELSSSG